ncbi:MAG TPA: response regulator [Flavisolibacter sp.]|nr:response regulator [Flavisolibacter sp.]
MLYIVDDDEDDLLFIHTAFKEIGLDNVCKGFLNGPELLQHLRFNAGKEIPDVIILDYQMPKMNGKEVLVSIRRQPWLQSTPVIFYSDKINDSLDAELKELGAFCCIRKGVTPGDQRKFARTITDLLKK